MIPATAEFAKGFCARNGIDRMAARRRRLVIEELFTNTIRHGRTQPAVADPAALVACANRRSSGIDLIVAGHW